MNRSSPPLLLALLVVLVLLGLVAVRSWNNGEPGPETLVLSPPIGEPPPSGSPNVLFIVWDTVRADRLSLYGHDRPTTPWLETFAEEAVVYDQAVSASFWTLPAHSSLFTGLPASAHRAINRRDPWLDGQFTTLAEHLGAGGWDTYAWSTNPYVYVTTNVLQGFATVDDPMREGPWRDKALADTERCLHPGDRSSKASPEHPERGRLTPKNAGETIHVALVDWLEQRRDPERPFFAFLNYMEAHTPRLPCAEARETMLGHDPELAELALSTVADTHRLHRQTLRQGRPLSERQIEAILGVYDATLLELDRKTGALIRDLESRGLLDDTIVVITSDHGEQFGEHGLFNHNFSVYQSLVHVPLVIRYPRGMPPGRVAETVSTRAVYPTVLDLLGLEPPRDDLLPSLRESLPNEAVAELIRPHSFAKGRKKLNRAYRALYEGPWKIIVANDGSRELYDVASDPRETTDRSGDQPDRREAMAARTETWRESVPEFVPTARPEMPSRDELREGLAAELEALGYVEP